MFKAVVKKLKVLARASAEDKFILVSGIRGRSGLVGMTGEGISDAKALQCASVGLCMGSGCDVAKDSSDLVIMDNKFESIHKSMMWVGYCCLRGHVICHDNVRKFIQF